jgi:hypothetical protein
MSTMGYKQVEDEFVNLFQQYTFEEAEKYLSAGQTVNQKELSERVVNRACEELMRKYGITMPEMVSIVERVAGRLASG